MENIKKYLAPNIRKFFENIPLLQTEEIRLRAAKPIVLEELGNKKMLNYTPSQKEITETLEIMSEHSIYAFMEEIKNGFITLKGGHRVGICGRIVLKNNEIHNITQISGLNIRISKQIYGIADELVKHNNFTNNTLILSPPNCGKTTLLRELSRLLSQTSKVSILDERGEIAAMHKGEPSYDIGENTDVLDLCPKTIGITMLIRSMSPEILIVDEIGSNQDIETLQTAVNSGVIVIATAHAKNIQEAKARIPNLEHIFRNFIIISRNKGEFKYTKETLI